MRPVLRLAGASGTLALAALGVTAGVAHSATPSQSSYLSAASSDVQQVSTDTPTTKGKHRFTDAQKAEFKKSGHLAFTIHTKKRGDLSAQLRVGHVTAVSPTAVTVKSKDGSSATFAIAKRTKVRQKKATAPLSAVTVGSRVGVLAVDTKNGADTAFRIRLLPTHPHHQKATSTTGTAAT